MLGRTRWVRHDRHRSVDVGRRVRAGAWKGMLAGAGGVAVMTLGEKLEQAITKRPDSYMPAQTLQRLLGRRDGGRRAPSWNLGMHVGEAGLVRARRRPLGRGGPRGPPAPAGFPAVRP